MDEFHTIESKDAPIEVLRLDENGYAAWRKQDYWFALVILVLAVTLLVRELSAWNF
jgi:hypothetical protein